MLDLLVPQVLEERPDVGIAQPGQDSGEERVRLGLRPQRRLERGPRGHEGTRLVVVGGLHVEEHGSREARRRVPEPLAASRRERRPMLLLVARHEAKEARGVGRMVRLHLVGELLVALARLLFDEEREVEGVPERQGREVDARRGAHRRSPPRRNMSKTRARGGAPAPSRS